MLGSNIQRYSPAHERANVWTHGFGIVLFLLAGPWLIRMAINCGSSTQAWGTTAFFVALLCLYSASTAYHAVSVPKKKRIFRTIDHISIYLLIGGTYTPFILFFYAEPAGLRFLLIHWIVIVCGIFFKLFYTGKYEFFSTALYLFLGWMVVFIIEPVMANMPADAFEWLAVGGLCYTVGVVFYVLERLPFNHAIWHVFVLGGSVGHYMALYCTLC